MEEGGVDEVEVRGGSVDVDEDVRVLLRRGRRVEQLVVEIEGGLVGSSAIILCGCYLASW